MNFGDDNSGEVLSITSGSEPGHLTGSYNYFVGNEACLLMVDLAPR
jgi:hypothetical protein